MRIYRGDSATVRYVLKNADGTPFDVTIAGLIFRYRITRYPGDESHASVRKDLTNGIALVPGVGVDITLLAGDTDLPIGPYASELKVWDGEDVAATATGTVIIKRAVRMGVNATVPQANLVIDRKVPTRTP